MTVWLEIGAGVVALLQSVLLALLWMQARHLRAALHALGHNAVHGCTDVPTSMLVTALGRLEHRLGMLELPASKVPRPSYDLARQLAREGADVGQLVDRCDLSPDEASLIVQMHSGVQPTRV
ncbi:MAG: DUF2802 domain-containing protein [Rhodanobacter sp.]